MALLGWNAITVLNHDKILVSYGEKIEFLQDKSKEIVPRSENERRYQGLEVGQQRNYEAIQHLEQSCYEALANAKPKLDQ